MPFGTEKTRMAWLPDSEKIWKICLFVLTECTNATDTQTDTTWWHRPRLHSIARQKLRKNLSRVGRGPLVHLVGI